MTRRMILGPYKWDDVTQELLSAYEARRHVLTA